LAIKRFSTETADANNVMKITHVQTARPVYHKMASIIFSIPGMCRRGLGKRWFLINDGETQAEHDRNEGSEHYGDTRKNQVRMSGMIHYCP
jgi:hypothetical protein